MKKLFPECDDIEFEEEGFVPHLVLGEWTSLEVEEIMKEYEDGVLTKGFNITGFTVLGEDLTLIDFVEMGKKPEKK